MPGVGGTGAGQALRVGGTSSGAGREGGSGAGRAAGKGAVWGVGRAGGGCLPEGPGEVAKGTRRGLGPSAEPLPGSGQGGREKGGGGGQTDFGSHCAEALQTPVAPTTSTPFEPRLVRRERTPPGPSFPPLVSELPTSCLNLCPISLHPCTCLPLPLPVPNACTLCPHPLTLLYLWPLISAPSPYAPPPNTPDKVELCRVWGQQRKRRGTPHQLPSGRWGAREREHSSKWGRGGRVETASQPPALASLSS